MLQALHVLRFEADGAHNGDLSRVCSGVCMLITAIGWKQLLREGWPLSLQAVWEHFMWTWSIWPNGLRSTEGNHSHSTQSNISTRNVIRTCIKQGGSQISILPIPSIILHFLQCACLAHLQSRSTCWKCVAGASTSSSRMQLKSVTMSFVLLTLKMIPTLYTSSLNSATCPPLMSPTTAESNDERAM